MRCMLGSAVAAMLLGFGIASAEELSTRGDESPPAGNVATVQVVAPSDVRISLDGRDQGSRSMFRFESLKPGRLHQHELTVRFPSGGSVGKTLLLRGGSRYQVPVRDPRAVSPKMVVQIGHASKIRSLAFSPDGKHALTGSSDRTAILWEVATGIRLRRFVAHDEAVTSVAFSPDGKRFLTGSKDSTAILWETATGKRIRTFDGHERAAMSVAFSSDGKWQFTGAGNEVVLWDAGTGEKLRTFKGHEDGVNSVAVSLDGKRILAGTWGKTAILWDTATGDRLHTFDGHTNGVSSVAFAPDGKSVLTSSWGTTTAVLWDAATGNRLRSLEAHRGRVNSMAFSPEGKRVLTGSGDDTAILWDVDTGNKLRTFEGHEVDVISVTYSPEGDKVLTGAENGAAALWDTKTGDLLRTFEAHPFHVRPVAISADTKRLLITGLLDKRGRLLLDGVERSFQPRHPAGEALLFLLQTAAPGQQLLLSARIFGRRTRRAQNAAAGAAHGVSGGMRIKEVWIAPRPAPRRGRERATRSRDERRPWGDRG